MSQNVGSIKNEAYIHAAEIYSAQRQAQDNWGVSLYFLKEYRTSSNTVLWRAPPGHCPSYGKENY